MVIRKQYLDECLKLLGTPVIKVLVGQRRAGKTILLRQIATHIGQKKVIFIDFEQYETQKELSTADSLYAYLLAHISVGTKAICIDEIQHISGRENVIVSVRNKYPAVDIFITGSNSSMLSSELTTLLRGRYYEIKVYLFSYQEFRLYYDLKIGKESFQSYLQTGGYASCYPFPDPEQRRQWIRQMMDSILLRDIIERYSIKEVSLFHDLYLYLISTNTQLTNVSSIQKELVKKGFNPNIITIQNYLRYLEENYLLYSCELYDIHGKKVFERLKKYYLSDHSLRSYFFSGFDLGWGKILENLVYMEAKKKGYQVYTGRKGDYEIDFILEKDTKKKYIQVAYLLANQEIITRETRSFDAIHDHRPKYLLSMDEQLLGQAETGFQHRHVWDIEHIL